MQKDGTIIQSGKPQDLYNKPSNSYVAEIFGETNKFKGIVKNSKINTPILTKLIGIGTKTWYLGSSTHRALQRKNIFILII